MVMRPTKGVELVEKAVSGPAGSRRGISAEELRRHNLSAVLERIHLGGSLSRSELATQTGLNRSTIRDLINELAELGLVVEDPGPAGQGPGRPSSVARPLPQGAVMLAIEIEVESIALATIGLGGHIFDETRVAHPDGHPGNPIDTVKEMVRIGRGLINRLPSDHHFVGVGVGVAGVVRRSDGYVHISPNLGWRGLPLGEMVASELGCSRVRLANEADMGALAEFRRGVARDSRHLLFVAGEVGVGLGIILEGEPMLGSAGYAGEAGHVIVNPQGRPCRCGSIGCWETEAGEEALLERAGVSGSLAGDRAIEELFTRAQERDERTLGAIEETGRWIGTGIGNLINMFNPDMVVLGGFFQVLYPFMEQTIADAAGEVSLQAPWETTRISPGELGTDAQLIGTAEMVLSEVIGDPATFRAAPETSPTLSSAVS